jgi:hypothetical protein
MATTDDKDPHAELVNHLLNEIREQVSDNLHREMGGSRAAHPSR